MPISRKTLLEIELLFIKFLRKHFAILCASFTSFFSIKQLFDEIEISQF